MIVTAAVPVEDRVKVCVAAVFTLTLPNADASSAHAKCRCTPAPSCSAKVLAVLPALAVKVAVCAVLTDETVAVKLPSSRLRQQRLRWPAR